MGGLLSPLRSAAGTLQVLNKALALVQSNVSNADTPGYVKQSIVLQSSHFQPENGDSGGLAGGVVYSSRNAYAERAVWQGQQRAGYTTQSADSLTHLENALPVGEQAAVPKAITDFFNTVSQWSVNPNAGSARQPVLDAAGRVAAAFRGVAADVTAQIVSADSQIQDTVKNINEIARQIQGINARISSGTGLRQDPGLDAEMHNAVEQLSEYVNVAAIPQDDGTVSILIAGQQALVTGKNLHPLSASITNTSASVADAQGNDITSELTEGKLGALLDSRNMTLPGVQQQINQLAQSFADQVNTVLRSGLDQSGNAPALDLFAYGSGANAAATLTANPLTTTQLAAASAGAAGGNAQAVQLANLGGSRVIQNDTFTAFYAGIAAQVGRQKNAADTDAQTEAAVLTQTRALREQTSKVSLDEEAAHLVELQRGYQAIAKMVTTLDDLTQSVIDILR